MSTIEQLREDMDRWIQNLDQPRAVLAGLPSCPWARGAWLRGSVGLVLGTDQYDRDLAQVLDSWDSQHQVVVVAWLPQCISVEQLDAAVARANELGRARGLVFLQDHPHEPEAVEDLVFNQGTWALAMLQPIEPLCEAALGLSDTGYYDRWDPGYLRAVLRSRGMTPEQLGNYRSAKTT